MANHRKNHPSRKHKGCAMCKPWKARGVNEERYSDLKKIDRARQELVSVGY